MNARKLAAIVGGIGLVGTFVLSGPTKKTECIRYRGYHNIMPEGEQKVFFGNEIYNAGVGFTPDSLKTGREYRLTLKRYFMGLGSEEVVNAHECEDNNSRSR